MKVPDITVRYLVRLPICICGWYWIRYLYNSDKRGVQVILFGHVFNLEWRRDIFREMNTGPRWVQSIGGFDESGFSIMPTREG